MRKVANNDPGSATGTYDVLETLTVPVRVRSERSPRSLRLEPLEVVEDVDWLVARREEVATAREADMEEDEGDDENKTLCLSLSPQL